MLVSRLASQRRSRSSYVDCLVNHCSTTASIARSSLSSEPRLEMLEVAIVEALDWRLVLGTAVIISSARYGVLGEEIPVTLEADEKWDAGNSWWISGRSILSI